VNFLLCRTDEDRVNLKKAAILALEAIFCHITEFDYIDACIDKLSLKCRDHAVAIRKQASQTLTSFLRVLPHHEKLITSWFRSVMPLIIDREPSVQQHCSKLFTVCMFCLF